MVWVLVCLGDTQYARHIAGPEYEEREEDDAPVLFYCTTHFTRKVGGRTHAESGGRETKNHVHSGHMRLTEG